MERTNHSNGADAPDPSTSFYVVDSQSGQKILVREMSDAQLASFRAGVTHVSQTKIRALIARLQLLQNPLDANLCINMVEQAITNAGLLLVLEYEQNRRLNIAPAVAIN